jgi:hypothetical protein
MTPTRRFNSSLQSYEAKLWINFRTYQAAQEEANRKWKEPCDEDDVLDHILNDMALEIFTNKHSYHHQVFFMKYSIFMGDGTTVVRAFEKRITWLNQCLKYFPMVKMRNGQYKKCTSLEEDELRDIYTLAIKPAWAAKIMESNSEPNDLSLAELIEYLEKLVTVRICDPVSELELLICIRVKV